MVTTANIFMKTNYKVISKRFPTHLWQEHQPASHHLNSGVQYHLSRLNGISLYIVAIRFVLANFLHPR